MPKRFTSTEIWEEDWFLEMPNEYKLFWYYILSACNHAGLFRVNIKKFCNLNNVSISINKAVEFFNNGKDRIRVISSTVWLIEDFFAFQYGKTFNPNNKLHESIEKAYNQQDIKMTSIRGLLDLKDRVKDKDKEINNNNGSYSNNVNAKFEKIDKKIYGKEFTKDGLYVVLSNGEKQILGTNQKFLLEQKSIYAKDIFKNYIV